ncbi:hypothetical protein SUGI_0493870 [Cryptomeria japonica]|nr:hypothetical protein SUGI_0493870 [Cryptomeria japonica]
MGFVNEALKFSMMVVLRKPLSKFEELIDLTQTILGIVGSVVTFTPLLLNSAAVSHNLRRRRTTSNTRMAVE